ncbi:hypothetical protein CLU79DRAFT_745709 [Phycomyces nitens]|nr:hypothetical protein CLU79DRAFT_745709 [Phycomyces nitens]
MGGFLVAIIFAGLTGFSVAIDPRWGQGCAYIDQTKQIYCFGGEPYSDYHIEIYALNITSNSELDLASPQWNYIPGVDKTIIPRGSSRFIFGGISRTDTVFLQGGSVCPNCTYNGGYSYNVTTNLWKQLTSTTPIMDTSSVILNDLVYYFGGETAAITGYPTTATILYNVLYTVNAKTGTTSPISAKGGSQLPQATWSSSMVYSSAFSSILIFGGQQYSDTTIPVAMNDIISINLQTGVYSKLSQTSSATGELPATRWGHSTVMDPTNVYAVMFGGCSDPGKAMNDLWLYNIAKRSWSPQPTTGIPPSPRCRHSAVVIGKYMFILFGGNNGVFDSDINVALDMSTWTWTTSPLIGAPADFGTPVVPPTPSNATSAPSSVGSVPIASPTQAIESITDTKTSSGISGGAIAGIVVGSIAGIGVIGALLFFFVFKNRNKYSNANNEPDDKYTASEIGNGMNNSSSQVEGGTSNSGDRMIKPDQIFGGSALPMGRIMLEAVKPEGR